LPLQRFNFAAPICAANPAENRRFANWFDAFRARDNRRDIAFRPDVPLVASIESLSLGLVGLSRTRGSFERIERRTGDSISNRDGPFVLVLNCGGSDTYALSGNRAVTVAPKGAVLFDVARPSTHVYGCEHHSIAISIPRQHMMTGVRGAEDLVVAPLDVATDALRLLLRHATALLDEDMANPVVLARAGQMLLDLALLVCGLRRDAGKVIDQRGLRAARREAVLRLIRSDYADPEMSPATVAARLGISTRYLHALLHETEASFAERIQELRLTHAFSLLTSGTRKVSDIAYAAGFNDLSYFNRSFRRRYGLTPKAARGTRTIV
jgi:AraC-like DNA-binding protein